MAALPLSPAGVLWKQRALEPCAPIQLVLEKDGTDSPPSLGM